MDVQRIGRTVGVCFESKNCSAEKKVEGSR